MTIASVRRPRVRRAIIPAAARVIDLGRPLTAEAFHRLPRTVERQELIDGRVVETGGITCGHGRCRSEWIGRLAEWNDARRLGVILPGVGFILDRDPDLVRGPDVAFIRHERVPAAQDEDAYVEGVPDAVIEVRNIRVTMPELRSKAEEYVGFGVAMVVLVDPKRRRIEVHRPGRKPVILNESDTFDGGNVLPGFRVAVAELI